MAKIKNVSPFGALDVPLLGVIVEAGETVDVTDEQAAVLLLQDLNFAPVGADAKAIVKDVTE